MSVTISEPTITQGESPRVEANITVNDKVYSIWYESPYIDKTKPLHAANSYVCISLLAGMATGQDIISSSPVSPELIKNLDHLQAVFIKWFPHFKKVSIKAPLSEAKDSRAKGVATTFSGGADSYFTLLEKESEVDFLLNARGFDVKLDDSKMFKLVNTSLQKIAKHHNKKLITISTNLRELVDDFGDWGYHAHAAALAGVIHILSGYIGTIYIPSTYNYSDLFPWGSHPITDRLWGTNYVKLVHHAAEFSRFNKIERIAQSQFALDNLTVCWQRIDIPENVRNCSKCEKCVRTMMALEALNKLGSQTSFSKTLDIEALRSFSIPSDHDYVFMKENYDYISQLDRTPRREEILLAIKSSLDNYTATKLSWHIKDDVADLSKALDDPEVFTTVSNLMWSKRTKAMLKMAPKHSAKKVLNKFKK